MRREGKLVLGISLFVLPLLGAVGSLFLGLALAELSLVYLSIALSAVAMPAMAWGIVLIVRGASSR